MTRLIAAAAPAPLWNSLGAALRQTYRSLTAPVTDGVFEALDSEQSRIRQSGRMWLVG